MNILVTIPQSDGITRFFTPALKCRLEQIGSVRWNNSATAPTIEKLRRELRGCQVCLSGWQTPRLDETTLTNAAGLRLLAHVGGSVASVASAALYARGVQVCSGNRLMARYVAEGVIAMMLTAQRELPFFDRSLHTGTLWPRAPAQVRSILGQAVGFVGLGTVGRCLLDFLQPFNVAVRVYDPYIGITDLASWPHAKIASLDEVLSESDIVSVHASLTEETIGLIGRNQLSRLRDGTLLVNAARGAIIDEAALIAELRTGRLRAALDVFTQEPLPLENPLRTLNNVLLSPHQVGAPSHHAIAIAMVDEIERFTTGRPLEYSIPLAQFQRMTRHELVRRI